MWLYKDNALTLSSPVAVENMLGNTFNVDRVDAALLWRKLFSN